MNKITTLLLTVLLAGCSHTSTPAQTTAAAVAPVTTVSVAQVSPPVDQPDEGPQPHQSPFKGKTWSLETSQNWIGLESEDGTHMMAINPIDTAKLIFATGEPEKSLTALVSRVRGNLSGHEVKITGQKNITINGEHGVQLDTHQGKLRVWVSVFNTKTNGYMFGCAGLADATATNAKTCTDARAGLHLTK